MKKIIIALAAIAMAICAQAAVVAWGTNSAVSFNGTKLGNQTVQLYIVGVDGAADMLVDTRTTANAPVVNKGKLGVATGAGQSSYDYNSVLAGSALLDSAGSDAGRLYYMVISYKDGTKEYTYTSSAVASTGLSSTALGSVAFDFTDTISSTVGAKDAWVAVPEPTSGLLMLVGLAGLALRRRRA